VGKNYAQFDRKKFHFGFALGINTADFHYRYNLENSVADSIVNINIKKQGGFNLGVISSWNVNENLHIRTIFPSIKFQERLFIYQYLKDGVLKTKETRLESTTFDFQLILKLRTKRIGNFAAYGLTGLEYSNDLATQSDAKPDLNEPFVRMKRHDFSYQFGGGFDFFLEYFKLGLEVKLSNGLVNVYLPDETFYMQPLTDLRTKVWSLSVTFEG
jgi:hypothetical protein